MANRVDISYCTSNKVKSRSVFNDDGELGYRIRVHCPDQRAALGIRFARRKDAEQGLSALLSIMSLDGTYDEVRSRIIEIGPKRIKQVVCESLAW